MQEPVPGGAEDRGMELRHKVAVLLVVLGLLATTVALWVPAIGGPLAQSGGTCAEVVEGRCVGD